MTQIIFKHAPNNTWVATGKDAETAWDAFALKDPTFKFDTSIMVIADCNIEYFTERMKTVYNIEIIKQK